MLAKRASQVVPRPKKHSLINLNLHGRFKNEDTGRHIGGGFHKTGHTEVGGVFHDGLKRIVETFGATMPTALEDTNPAFKKIHHHLPKALGISQWQNPRFGAQFD